MPGAGARRSSAVSAAGVLQVVVAASTWGTWSLFLRPAGLSGLVSAVVVFGVLGVATLALIPLDRVTPRWDRATLGLLVAMSVLDTVNMGAFFAAMDTTSVAIAVLTHYLAPVFVAVLAPHVDRESIPGAVAAAVVATVGLALVLEPWRAASGGALEGGALGALSAVAYAANVFIARRLVGRIGAARTLSYHAFLSGALLVPLAGVGALLAIPPSALVILLLGALGPGVLAGWLYLRGLRLIGSSRAAVLSFFEPLVAVTVGLLYWQEPLAPAAWLGGALILGAGLVVVARPGTNRQPDVSVG